MAWRIQVLVMTFIAWLAALILTAVHIPAIGERGGDNDVLWTLIPGHNLNQSLPQTINECNGPGAVELSGHSYSLLVGTWCVLGASLAAAFGYGILASTFTCEAIHKPQHVKSFELGTWWSPISFSLAGGILATLCFGMVMGMYDQYSLEDVAATMCFIFVENHDIPSRITTDWYTPSLLLLEIVQTRMYWTIGILIWPVILHFITGLIPCTYKEFRKDIKQWWREGRPQRAYQPVPIRPTLMNPRHVDPQSEDSVLEIHEPRRTLPCHDQLFEIFEQEGIVSIIEGYAVNIKTHYTLAPLYDSNSDTYFS